MHSVKKLALVAVAIAIAPLAAQARSSFLSTFNSTYGTANTVLDSCNLCHPSGTSSFNAYANDLSAANISSNVSSALRAVENLDSDRDSFSNVAEIEALSFPGDARSVPAPTAPAPKIAVSAASLSFGTITVGATGTQTTVVSNAGTGDLTVTAAPCSGTSREFSASPASFTVAAGGRQTLTVTYAPVDATTDTGCVALASNATTGTVNVTVSGTGQAVTPPPPSVVDVDVTRFGVAKRLDISRGGTATPAVSVVNAGAAGMVTITVEGVDAANPLTGVYSASQDVTLAAGATAKVKFPTFTPTDPGAVVFTATVVDDDPDTDTASVTVKVVP